MTDQIGVGDKVTLKAKELKKHKNMGMEYAFVTKVLKSQASGLRSVNLKSHSGQEINFIPEDQLIVLARAKRD